MDRVRAASFLFLTLTASSLASCGDASDEPLAMVGGESVSDARFAAHLRLRALHPRGDEETRAALDEYLRRRALSAAIEQTDVLDAELLAAELEEQATETRISRYFDRYLRTAVTDEAVRSYYEQHAADYEDREVHVAHILVRTQRAMTDEERQAALTRAREAHARLTAGEEFAAVAAELSEDAVSAPRGGDLGWLREGAIDPRFSERAFATEPGVATEPFETPFGYHVLRVLEAPATRRRPLAAVEGDIRYQLRAQARDAEMERLLGTVRVTQREGGYRPPDPSSEGPELSAADAPTSDEVAHD